MDPRLTPANEIVACSSLKGQIQHTNFVEGKNYQVSVPFVDLLNEPGGCLLYTSPSPRDRG